MGESFWKFWMEARCLSRKGMSRARGRVLATMWSRRLCLRQFESSAEIHIMEMRKTGSAAFGQGLEVLEGRRMLSAGGDGHGGDFVTQTNLVSDGATPAALVDPKL